MQRRDKDIPEELKEDKLKYRVEIKLLGSVKIAKDINSREKIIFVPSQRRLPHLGAKVSLPSDEVLEELCSLSEGHTNLGDYALGEFIYSGGTGNSSDMFRQISPHLKVMFNINNLVSKRSVVFARAGYGKSNLIKYLISELYKNNGKDAVTDRGNKVGTLIFDADGEYFWPDHKERPGLCDVPDIREQIVIFTSRYSENPYYEGFKAGDVKLDIRELPAADVIGIAVSIDRQEQQNILKLKSLGSSNWRKMVDLISEKDLQASDEEIGQLLGYRETEVKGQTTEIAAARSNMRNIVNHLHDPHSQLVQGMLASLREGHIVIIDISLLSSTAGNNIAGLLMRRIFNHNQENFTGGSSPIPVNVIIEEAQSVLGRRLEETSPFVEWVKEGRKYDLGAIMITQQPGSMAPEIMSQSDNWFSFHLLSEGDASTLGRYNSHFSHDVLAHIIGEPIPGNCYMWSAPKQPFVLPVRVRNFEELYGENVDKHTGHFEKSAAKKIKEKSEEYDKDIAEELFKIMKRDINKLSLDRQEKETGIYYGQLYQFFQEIKKIEKFRHETRSEEQLYKPILEKMLNYYPVVTKKGEHKKKGLQDYYYAPKEAWNNKFAS